MASGTTQTADHDAVIAKVADALLELEELGLTLTDRPELDPVDCNRFGARIHELRVQAIGLLEVLTSAPCRGRSH